MLKRAINSVKHTNLTAKQQSKIQKIVRVDQAGELGADYIYAGQHLVFSNTKPALAPLIKHMWEQEIHHHNTFDSIQTEGRVRPSLLTPVWKAAAFGLGVGTAALGKEAAMACTEAVETVIGGHYNTQLRWLHKEFADSDIEGITELKEIIKNFRDDELEHLDTAVVEGAKQAVPYYLLTETIKTGCRVAIWIAERV
ncbi:putative monooxygenase CAT5 [Sugiyamaella lignohabitans]|uniref:5-demethoxyubiquinone hydroxylase, mitochondrial n=1 Tax=Sugiyamaella lignohabitans TaxID=796027 RepID=A0A167CNH3_9ASCO|nr:putative monooxygenase CAT5 [Sugiyamaella lignohabitans]ANB11922.1 putative monooxygenase CAT5 [Sugiyamaella lignohabitans]